MHVLSAGHRPEAALLGEFADFLGPVHGTALAQLFEERVGWPLGPYLALEHEPVLELCVGRCHQGLQSPAGMRLRMVQLREAIWPGSQARGLRQGLENVLACLIISAWPPRKSSARPRSRTIERRSTRSNRVGTSRSPRTRWPS